MSQAEPLYTEGICGDGAAILKDGVMMSITDILIELNTRAALMTGIRGQIEATKQFLAREGYSIGDLEECAGPGWDALAATGGAE